MKRVFVISTLAVFSITFSAFATIINIPADYPTIQQGIDASTDGDTVLVHPGTYAENINYNGKIIVIGSLFLTTADTSYILSTIIDKNQNGPVVTFIDVQDSSAVLSGFTISNSTALHTGNMIACLRSSPTLRYLHITGSIDNQISGGGLWCMNGSSPKVENVEIYGNGASSGGGIYCYLNSSPTFINVSIYDNYALFGGGIYCNYGASPTLINVKITSNEALNFGGGIECYNNSNLIMKNVLISLNSADRGGGIYGGNNFATTFTNLTVTANQARQYGGAFFYDNFDLMLVNSIFWNNSPSEIYLFDEIYNSSFTAAYNDIEQGQNGVLTNVNFTGTINWLDGNIDSDPLFSDPLNGNFRLSQNSPCIDSGNPDTSGMYLPEFDLDGNPRIYNGRIDMGVYEWPGVLDLTDDLYLAYDFKLTQNYPNPFNATTTIGFMISESQFVKLTVYDLLGRQVKTLLEEYRQAGVHSVTFDASHLSSGVYFYRLQAGNMIETRRMVLLK
ncbi:MAG: T9SS type A sorting domain-containing protein [Candidatus Zixiibacteriota bacterium]|nr:MAG: T9SS type A sorting domain-containing protein [candidate division Zixibacteria bacterium]